MRELPPFSGTIKRRQQAGQARRNRHMGRLWDAPGN